MEIIIFLLLVWFFSRIFRKRTRKVVDKWEAFEVEAKRQEKQQARYDRYMMSLPELAGDENFSQQIRGERAYKESIDLFGEWMERYHPGEDRINVIVEAITTKDNQLQVRIEAGMAVLGFIPREEVADFHRELTALGKVARATARFNWSPDDGKSSITLDVVRPLRKV